MIKTELDIVRDISNRLEAAEIAFMLTGSMAMNYYAQPRMTRDVDLVISLDKTQIEKFLSLFEGDYYFERRNVIQAVSQRRMFNLIHYTSVIKVDFVVLKTDDFKQEEFARRKRISISDFHTWVVSREDLILSKLLWAKTSKSEMQLSDVRNLLTGDCDMTYIHTRAEALAVTDLLEELLVDE